MGHWVTTKISKTNTEELFLMHSRLKIYIILVLDRHTGRGVRGAVDPPIRADTTFIRGKDNTFIRAKDNTFV